MVHHSNPNIMNRQSPYCRMERVEAEFGRGEFEYPTNYSDMKLRVWRNSSDLVVAVKAYIHYQEDRVNPAVVGPRFHPDIFLRFITPFSATTDELHEQVLVAQQEVNDFIASYKPKQAF